MVVFIPPNRSHHRLGAAVLTLLAACSFDEGQQRRPCSSERSCVLDPQPHGICQDGCRDDEDCPVGATCLTLPEQALGSCRAPILPLTTRDELLRGFDVPELSARVVELEAANGAAGGPVLDWTAPEDSVLVSCALFACPPVIYPSGEITGRREIINYDRCVIAQLRSTQSSGSFNPRNPEYTHAPSEPHNPGTTSACATHPVEAIPQAIEGLWFGCWAYDSWSLIAATKLHPLELEDVHDHRNSLAQGPEFSCTEDDAGRTCLNVVLPDSDSSNEEQDPMPLFMSLGACTVENRCAHRCVRDADCYEYCVFEGDLRAAQSDAGTETDTGTDTDIDSDSDIDINESQFSGHCVNANDVARESDDPIGVCKPCPEAEP